VGSQRRTDSHVVHVVCHLDRGLRYTRLTGRFHVTSGCEERAVALIDCGQSLVSNVVDIREVGELPLR
jgi:hypothetical protein